MVKVKGFQTEQKLKKFGVFEVSFEASNDGGTLIVKSPNESKEYKLTKPQAEKLVSRLIEYGCKQLISDAHAGKKEPQKVEALYWKLLGERVYSERTSKIAKIKELKAQFQQGKLSQEDFFKALSELGI